MNDYDRVLTEPVFDAVKSLGPVTPEAISESTGQGLDRVVASLRILLFYRLIKRTGDLFEHRPWRILAVGPNASND